MNTGIYVRVSTDEQVTEPVLEEVEFEEDQLFELDLDNVANTITFKSSLYSTYSLVREPEVKSSEKVFVYISENGPENSVSLTPRIYWYPSQYFYGIFRTHSFLRNNHLQV